MVLRKNLYVLYFEYFAITFMIGSFSGSKVLPILELQVLTDDNHDWIVKEDGQVKLWSRKEVIQFSPVAT